jgi:hypothetical protein
MHVKMFNVTVFFELFNVLCVIHLDVLLELIRTNQYPMKVWISEDATSIIPKREFHLRYNAILGGSLPLRKTGLPDPKSGVVNSVSNITNYFKLYNPAKVFFAIMAQSMADFSPPVRIGTFASDNKMTALDVKNRHYYIKERLKSVGIEINASGSDGDTREMIFMLQNSGLGVQLSDFTKDTDDYRFFAKCKVFACLIRMSDFDLQDVPHIFTKLRNKFFKTDIIALGDYIATPNDLRILIEQKSKKNINPERFVHFQDSPFSIKFFSGSLNSKHDKFISFLVVDLFIIVL